MTVSVLGCGWFGLHLAQTLIQEGHLVKGSTTSVDKLPRLAEQGVDPYLVNLTAANDQSLPHAFFQCDILVITVPVHNQLAPGTAVGVFIESLINTLVHHAVRHVVLISSTSVYGNVNGEIDETTATSPETLSGEALVRAEQLLQQQPTFTTTIIRFGGLVGPGRHPGRFLAGKKDIANGLAPVNLIHLYDCTGICVAVLNHTAAWGKTLNACCPHHPSRKDFYTAAAVQAGLSAPEFIDERTQWKIVNSVHVNQLFRYTFKVSDWFRWLMSEDHA